MGKIKILVVDDSPTELKMMSEPFIARGHEVLTAMDGEEALQVAQRERPSLVVLDVIMPKKNGFQVCRDIKGSPQLKDTKVILLTSKNQESDRFWGQKQGADEYMTKPFVAEELVTVAERLL
jgi:twitching motility two-component system response regulator PilH